MEISFTTRCLAALVAAAAMFGVCLSVAFNEIRSNPLVRSQQWRSLNSLKELRTVLEQYRQEHGSYPENLSKLDLANIVPQRWIEDDHPLDAWQNPVEYEATEDGYRLISFGRDGLQGGTGLDADLDGAEEISTPHLAPSFRQFLELCPGPMWFSCVATALLTFFLCVNNTRPRDGQPLSIRQFLGNFVAALFVVGIVGLFLVLLHVPSGH